MVYILSCGLKTVLDFYTTDKKVITQFIQVFSFSFFAVFIESISASNELKDITTVFILFVLFVIYFNVICIVQ